MRWAGAALMAPGVWLHHAFTWNEDEPPCIRIAMRCCPHPHCPDIRRPLIERTGQSRTLSRRLVGVPMSTAARSLRAKTLAASPAPPHAPLPAGLFLTSVVLTEYRSAG